MMRTRERDSSATAARQSPTQRQSVFDALLQPPFAELSIARSLMSALSSAAPQAAPFVPAVSVCEKDGKYLIDVALPGFKRENVEVDVSGNELTISGKYEEEHDNENAHYTEMRQASFTRTIAMPQELDPDKVKATFENGILHITAEPVAAVSHKKIAIDGR